MGQENGAINKRCGKGKEGGVSFHWEEETKETGDAAAKKGSTSKRLRLGRTCEMMERMARGKVPRK